MIVVIAILASITAMTFSGVRDRAMNTARIASARQTVDLVIMYKTLNGSYPVIPDHPVNDIEAACLGTGWPVMNEGPSCWNVYDDGEGMDASTFFQYDSINSELETVGALPNFPKDPAGVVSHPVTGRKVIHVALTLMHRSYGSASFGPAGYSIGYLLKSTGDNTDCGISGAIRTITSTGTTRCIVPLPS